MPEKKETVAREVEEVLLRVGWDRAKISASHDGRQVTEVVASGMTAKIEYPAHIWILNSTSVGAGIKDVP